MYVATLMLLGFGELGREFTIAAKRLGCRVIACDRYADAPAMQMADAFEIFSMLDGEALRTSSRNIDPTSSSPKSRRSTPKPWPRWSRKVSRSLLPPGRSRLTMNRDGIRDFAARELGLITSRYRFAESRDEALALLNSRASLRGQTGDVEFRQGPDHGEITGGVGAAWDYAVSNMRGDRPQVIVEEFIAFDSEITLLTVASRDGVTFCAPIGHRQDHGDYRESWQPASIPREALLSARYRSRKMVEALGGFGIFGVEFFVRGDQASSGILAAAARYRTGHAHLAIPNEFELHLRAVLGLPIPAIEIAGPSASAVILASEESDNFSFDGLADALGVGAP